MLEQWREQCGYEELEHRYRYFARHYRPSVALIEAAANGPALIAEAKRKKAVSVIEIIPDGRPKTARLHAHASLIRRRSIYLPDAASWKAAYIKEFVGFPSGKFDDQVDATTQYLDWITTNAVPELPSKLVGCVGVGSDGLPLRSSGNSATKSVSGMVVGRRRWKANKPFAFSSRTAPL